MRSLLQTIMRAASRRKAISSEEYWKCRYGGGGNSGPGSYNHLAEFKAEVINRFVAESRIESVIEFGCGDGNQLRLADYRDYAGYDISPVAIATCRQLFDGDSSKKFFLAHEYDGRKADLALSLDVVFHLTEDAVFDSYMRTLFGAAKRNVIVYSSNRDAPVERGSEHVRHRQFTNWVERELADRWLLIKKIPNAYPYDGNYQNTSFADFYVYGLS